MARIPIKNEEEIAQMREVCKKAAIVLDRMCELVKPGVNTYDLDQAGRVYMEELGCKSACHNYRSSRGGTPYPSYTCISVNNEVVHGIGTMKRIIEEGDNVSVDVVVEYEGFLGDNARTVLVEPVSPQMEFLVKSTEEALYVGIDQARAGKRVGDISHAVQRFIEARKLSVVREFVGHGVGRSMHEEPQIPNFGRKGKGDLLKPGMTLAIEPMVNQGRAEVRIAEDGWTALTCDGKAAAHFEHTVLIREDEPEILTRVPEPAELEKIEV